MAEQTSSFAYNEVDLSRFLPAGTYCFCLFSSRMKCCSSAVTTETSAIALRYVMR